MSMQDIVSDYVSRVNNALNSEKKEVTVLKSNFIINITKLLTKLGFYNSFEILPTSLRIEINTSLLKELVRVSKPGKKYHVKKDSFPKIVNGIGFTIVTTSDKKSPVKTHIACLKDKVGGEAVLQVIKN
jgi:small subunit ribosomal protein S8